MTSDDQKRLAAEAALGFIPEGAIVGVGTGSTVNHFIQALKAKRDLILGAVSSSEQSTRLLRSMGIEVLDLNCVADLPIYVDGADEATRGLDLIKVGNYETSSRGYVGRFNFKGTQQQQFIGDLSGGERNRVHLAKVLKSGGNVLLLDEPTNDLDIETLRALEEALVAFPGCAVVISHDRWFLDRIATHILAFEGDSQVAWFEGNYQEYVEDYKRRKGEDASQPHRIRYKPLG